MTKLFHRGVAAAAAFASVAAVNSAALVLAQETDLSPIAEQNLSRLSSCISNKKQADLLFVIDESASLRGHNGPATDPENVRVAAAQDLIQQLGKVANNSNADINVKLAGFGEKYSSDPAVYGEWTNVRTDVDKLTRSVAGFAERNNEMYTNYSVALNGALRDISAHSQAHSCRSILFFTDGQLTVPGDKAADQAAQERICAAHGVVESLRHSQIQLFIVGLIPQGEGSPEKLLRDMAETNECGPNLPANGAFFNAKDNPAALFGAFRQILPDSGSASFKGSTEDFFNFTLDNSITDVRLEAQPEEAKGEKDLIPVLKTPTGQVLELNQPSLDVQGVKFQVQRGETLPGMVDVSITKPEEVDWSGQWSFGYRATEGNHTTYRAKMQIFPGLHISVDELREKENAGLSNQDMLTVTLLDKNGTARRLDGDAMLTATFVPTGAEHGEALTSPQPIKDGNTVTIPLQEIDNVATGDIVLTAHITTKGKGEVPGTQLSPLTAQFPVTITPVNMPKISAGVDIAVESKEITFNLPVEGPGSVWLGDTGGVKATLPEGVAGLAVSSPNNSKETALTLAKGEKAQLPVTLSVEKLADGPIALSLPVQLVSEDQATNAAVELPVTGTMRVPVNTAVFSVAMILALLLGLLIPLAILYTFKYITGVIPRKKIYGYSFPIAVDNDEVIRTDGDRAIALNTQDMVFNNTGVMPQPRSIVVAGKKLSVTMGWNPFASAYVLADSAPSIFGKGNHEKQRAKLPLSIAGHWIVYALHAESGTGQVLVLVDEHVQQDSLDALSSEIKRGAKDLLDTLAHNAPQNPPSAEDASSFPQPQDVPEDFPTAQPQEQSWPSSGATPHPTFGAGTAPQPEPNSGFGGPDTRSQQPQPPSHPFGQLHPQNPPNNPFGPKH
ncbi:VWA domain-containing protein [Corynebacterium felinum]|uniref:VWFA domain-containing protein n=1 Tax=Corynebacterium felinum TaxID=131318 RepID=A0ABU2B7A9_9CORY|nr:VWA domain-containing protein [Corynebacterium felinum]MDF5820172.1 VWA domain-containing protein [Corynebacterium felinum]MDR7353924.1 hypothetical protein [Corynebacterium felinum]WJY96097.1 von Willebrand factor type A domain protein [Corynebacterium felinum]